MPELSMDYHIQTAFDLITDAGNSVSAKDGADDGADPAATLLLAEAQIHATLAVAEQLRTLTDTLAAALTNIARSE